MSEAKKVRTRRGGRTGGRRRVDAPRGLLRVRLAPEPRVVESLNGREALLRVEDEQLVEEVGEEFAPALAARRDEAASATRTRGGEREEREVTTHTAHLALISRPRSGHCAPSLPSTPGSLLHPGMLSAVGGPHSLREKVKVSARSWREGEGEEGGEDAPEDLERLVKVRLAGEDRLAVVHLAEDAAAHRDRRQASSVELVEGKERTRGTHPTPHMSTAVWYLRSPRRSSGGRYHLVTTVPVYICVCAPRGRVSEGFSTTRVRERERAEDARR